tara:strand:- start:5084 stop:5650 length:567 start_codon:yes stop_codon:yes gene_type:complete
MIFNFDQYLDYKYKLKNNLDIIPKNSKKFKEYKKNLRGNNENVIKMKSKIVKKFADNISEKFIDNVCSDKLNKILFYSMNHTLHNNEITSIIIYRKILNTSNKIRVIIFIIAVRKELRNNGYGSLTLHEFTNYIYKKKPLEIILHSLKTSLHFYLNYGFKQIERNKFIEDYEGIYCDQEHIILKYVLS